MELIDISNIHKKTYNFFYKTRTKKRMRKMLIVEEASQDYLKIKQE